MDVRPATNNSYSAHIRAVLTLGLPLIGSHVAQYALQLTDALMLGRYDVVELAGEVIGGTVFFVLFIMGSGFAWAVMPLVANAEGAGDQTQVRRVTRMAIWLSMIFAALVLPVFLMAKPLLLALGQEPTIADLADMYLGIVGWSIFPALLVMVLKSYLAALERTHIVLWVTLGAVVLNAVFNYALIFGNLGAPEMGIRGAAIATLAVNLASFLALAVYVVRRTPEHALFTRFWRADWEAFWRVFRLGWPISLTSLAEVGLFAAASIMLGWLGTLQLAAHGIALQITSVTFMVHLGLSNVATVRAGNALGRMDPAGLQRGAMVVAGLSGLTVLATVALFLGIPEFLIGLFLNADQGERAVVIAIGTGLLAAAALFQLADAAQVMALGLLRGVQDTRAPMLIAALSYWAIGVPASYVMGFKLGMGGVGVWLGLAIGLAVAGVLMTIRFMRYLRRARAAG